MRLPPTISNHKSQKVADTYTISPRIRDTYITFLTDKDRMKGQRRVVRGVGIFVR